jgi:hypothetical protein
VVGGAGQLGARVADLLLVVVEVDGVGRAVQVGEGDRGQLGVAGDLLIAELLTGLGEALAGGVGEFVEAGQDHVPLAASGPGVHVALGRVLGDHGAANAEALGHVAVGLHEVARAVEDHLAVGADGGHQVHCRREGTAPHWVSSANWASRCSFTSLIRASNMAVGRGLPGAVCGAQQSVVGWAISDPARNDSVEQVYLE